MLPTNAREGDFVEVHNKANNYFGMVGRIKQMKPTEVTVDIYGKFVDVSKTDLTLRARAGTGTHDAWVEQVTSQEPAHLDEIGYDGLIDLAIDMQEWGWATDLVNRKNELIAGRKAR